MSARHHLHLGLAEQGKILALGGDHVEALRHYREAIRLAVSGKAPEVFFRHYTQCVLESLELQGSFDEVIRFCRDADQHYRGHAQLLPVQRRDHGAILERLGVVLLKQGQRDEGRTVLQEACRIAGERALPLAEEVLAWMQRGLHVDARRLTGSQRRHHYFVVRSDQVDRRRARSLPASGRRNAAAIRGNDPILTEIPHG